MDDFKYLLEYYENYDEDGRLTTRFGYVEYLTTMKYIDRYLFDGARILEIGAGTGRYSHALARKGYEVDSVELIEHNIEVFKSKITPDERITVRQGNAIDLSFIEDEKYDITLLLGPMYHLYTEEDKLKALSEAVRVTKRGGVIFAAYCMGDASVLQYGFGRGIIRELIEKCLLDPETFDTFSNPWDLFELHRKEDIDALRTNFDVEQLHFVATDGYANHIRERLAEMDEDTYELFIKYHLATCERLDLIGYSNHTLDIFKRK
ncbi:MAG: class I SAM-dependent methyltransferase [Clostridia bacterium]|nr:class I SAM-dependent methyltransferase [Clostridia bacterium]